MANPKSFHYGKLEISVHWQGVLSGSQRDQSSSYQLKPELCGGHSSLAYTSSSQQIAFIWFSGFICWRIPFFIQHKALSSNYIMFTHL